MIRERYDVAISFRHFDIDVFYVMENVRARKKFFWIHGVQPLNPDDLKILRPYYDKYDGILPVSNSAKNHFLRYFPELEQKCSIAYCIVDGQEIQDKARYGIKIEKEPGSISILTIGRLGEEKGIDIVVAAAKIIKDQGLVFKWLVAGDGNQKDIIQRQIRDNGLEKYFFPLGNVENPYGLLESCDIYVQPSRLESYGLAVNEAKILHKPIICSNIPAGREQILHERTGLLFDGTVEDLAAKITLLSGNEQMPRAFEEELFKEDWSHFETVELFSRLFVEKTEG